MFFHFFVSSVITVCDVRFDICGIASPWGPLATPLRSSHWPCSRFERGFGRVGGRGFGSLARPGATQDRLQTDQCQLVKSPGAIKDQSCSKSLHDGALLSLRVLIWGSGGKQPRGFFPSASGTLMGFLIVSRMFHAVGHLALCQLDPRSHHSKPCVVQVVDGEKRRREGCVRVWGFVLVQLDS